MNWAMPSVWSTPTTPQPSWLPSTSGWTQRASNFLMMTAEEYSNFMVGYHQVILLTIDSEDAVSLFSSCIILNATGLEWKGLN